MELQKSWTGVSDQTITILSLATEIFGTTRKMQRRAKEKEKEKTTQRTRSPRGAFAVWLQILPDSGRANPGTARTHLLDRCQRSGV